MATSLTVLSKRELEKEGYVVERVEHFNFFTKRRVDLLGVGDLLALKKGETLLVQVTSRANLSTRRKKCKESDKLVLWLSAKNGFILHGWDKYKNKWRLKKQTL